MSEITPVIRAAYQIFGLQGGENLDQVRDRFRMLIKTVHPDTAGNNPKTLAKLQKMLKAYEVLQKVAPRCFDLVLTTEEARKGGVRALKIHGNDAMVRIPVCAKTNTTLPAIGDSRWHIRITVRDQMVDVNLDQGQGEINSRKALSEKFDKQRAGVEKQKALEEADNNASLFKAFCDSFVKASPAARFARWARGAKA